MPDFTKTRNCKTLPEIVEDLKFSYDEVGGINHLDGTNLPNREAIRLVYNDLIKLIFPGFYEDDAIRSESIEYYIGTKLHFITEKLTTEIRKALDYTGSSENGRTAKDIACTFLAELPQVRTMINSDVQAAFEGDPAAVSKEEVILAYPGLEAIAIQRLANSLYKMGVGLIPRMMTEIAHSKTGIDIHPGADIGEFFFIDHGTGVVIGETSKIGNRVKIYQGVTLGAKSFKKDTSGRIVKGGKRHPTIEDDVTIYAGATILGGDTVIGKGSVIGGNVWLLDSVPAYSLITYDEGETRRNTLLPVAGEDAGAGI